jgi:hypothetical protein
MEKDGFMSVKRVESVYADNFEFKLIIACCLPPPKTLPPRSTPSLRIFVSPFSSISSSSLLTAAALDEAPFLLVLAVDAEALPFAAGVLAASDFRLTTISQKKISVLVEIYY